MSTPSLDERVGQTIRAWQAAGGHPAPSWRLERLTGDASNRIYVRVHLEDPAGRDDSTVMAMVMPMSGGPAEEFGSRGTSAGLGFIEMADWLQGRGVPVPRRFHFAPSAAVLLLEDLGDMTLECRLASVPSEPLYEQAVDLLVDFQRRTANPEPSLEASRRVMDRAVLAWELDHYVQWRLEADLGHPPGAWRDALTLAFRPLLDELCGLPTRLIHRDFQSRNLMLTNGELRLIDFQDAMLGPYIYDLVALLRDSYVVLSNRHTDALVARYAEAATRAELIDVPRDRVVRAFRIQTVQRKLKDTGRFVFIDRVKDNPHFLPFRAASMAYVHQALASLDDYATLRQLIGELDPHEG